MAGVASGATPQDATRWLDDEEQARWRAYLRGVARTAECMERALSAAGLSLSEYEVLAMLSEAPGRRLRMSALADAVLQSRSRLAHTAARMEKRGWVVRERLDTDRRGVEIHLTEAGMATLVDTAPRHVESVRQGLLDPLGREDFLALGALMQRVLDAHAEADRARATS